MVKHIHNFRFEAFHWCWGPCRDDLEPWTECWRQCTVSRRGPRKDQRWWKTNTAKVHRNTISNLWKRSNSNVRKRAHQKGYSVMHYPLSICAVNVLSWCSQSWLHLMDDACLPLTILCIPSNNPIHRRYQWIVGKPRRFSLSVAVLRLPRHLASWKFFGIHDGHVLRQPRYY